MIQEGGADDSGKSFVINSFSIPDQKTIEAYQTPEAAAARLLEKPVKVHFFTDGPDAQFQPTEFTEYLGHKLGPNFTLSPRGDIRTYILNQEKSVREKAISQLVAISKPILRSASWRREVLTPFEQYDFRGFEMNSSKRKLLERDVSMAKAIGRESSEVSRAHSSYTTARVYSADVY